MKRKFCLLIVMACMLFIRTAAQTSTPDTKAVNAKQLFIDVHHLKPGVKFNDVMKAHAADLSVQNNYGVEFHRFWVDEEKALVYCLSSATDTAAVSATHAKAHGLLPQEFYVVKDGQEAALKGSKNLYLDIHELGEGKVTAKDVEAAHQKDLSVQGKHQVNFVNYWVDEKKGTVLCLSEAKDQQSVIKTHKEAHGLIPVQVLKVVEGK